MRVQHVAALVHWWMNKVFSLPQTLLQQVLISVNTSFEIQKRRSDAFLLEVNEINIFMFLLAFSHMILGFIKRREIHRTNYRLISQKRNNFHVMLQLELCLLALLIEN